MRRQHLPLCGPVNKHSVCESCQLGKSKQLPFSLSSRWTKSPLELIHSDVWTSPVPSLSGCRFYVVFIDDYSRYFWLYPIINKSDIFQCFVKFKLLVEKQFSAVIKQFQSDNGGEYTSNQFKPFLSQNGILHRLSCPHTSQQNGTAERKHKHVVEIGLTLLAQSGLSSKYWVDAFLTATFLINRLPTPVLNNESPFSKLFGKQPDYTFLKSFGCLCYPLLRPYAAHKLSFRSKPCIFLGYVANHYGYRCLEPHSSRIYISRHVVFDEFKFPAKGISLPQGSCIVTATPGTSLTFSPNIPIVISSLSQSTSAAMQPHLLPSSPIDTCPLHTNESSSNINSSSSSNHGSHSPTTLSQSTTLSPSDINPLSATINLSPSDINLSPTPTPTELPPPYPQLADTSANRIVTRSQIGHLKPKKFPGYKMFFTPRYPLFSLQAIHLPLTPTTYRQAAAKQEWIEAMTSEYNALLSNNTWTLCPRLPKHNVVRNKWVFKIKQKPDGSVDRFKARLVAKGFDQKSGIDYHETFSPIIKPATIRLLLALAVHFNWELRQFDVSNAFLHGLLNEEVYMEQPPGFVDPTCTDFVCKLHKSIYGLKQAPRAWFTRLAHALLNIGFIASQVDYSLFIYHRGSIHIFLLVYVDDIIITGNHHAAIDCLIRTLQLDFAMKDLGPLSYFLGIQVLRNSSGLHLRQPKYVIDLLDRVQMVESKAYRAPCVAGTKMSKFEGEVLPDPTIFRHIVGALQYVTLTRPDIAYSVNQLCQHMHHPTSVHMTAAKRVLRYLKGSVDCGLHYYKISLTINAFCDADWAGNPDDRRSTTGYGIFLGSNLISWSAKKQHVVSLSSTEAEYRSMCLTTAEMYWIRMLFCELQLPLLSPPTLWCDNSGALALASNPVFHARTKHIEVDFHFIREKVTNKDIQLRYLSTLDQLADIFTKGLLANRFCLLWDKLRVCAPISLQGGVKTVAEHYAEHHDSKPPLQNTMTASPTNMSSEDPAINTLRDLVHS
jgi:hypothetical protein